MVTDPDPQSEQPSAPESLPELQERLQQVIQSAPKRMQDCAVYLAANSDRIAISTVAELAKGAGVAPSALMRFCQMLGFSGFSEMQRLYRDSYVPVLPDYEARLASLRRQGQDSPTAILGEFVEAGRKSLEKLVNDTPQQELERAVEILAEASLIHLIGLRRAYPVSSYMAYALEKMSVPAILHDQAGRLDHGRAMRDGDALIAVSFSPYTPETLALADQAVARGLPVVAITDSPAGPFQREGIQQICVSEANFGAFRSLSASLSIAITLAVAVGARRKSGGMEIPS